MVESSSNKQQPNGDLEHLQLLALFHYINAGITALFSCFPFIHVGLGLAMIYNPHFFSGHESPPKYMAWTFVIMGSAFILCGWTLAVLTFISGRFLKQQKHRLFSLVIAGLECCCMPLGTVLGVFTLVVLMRPSVKELYEHKAITQES